MIWKRFFKLMNNAFYKKTMEDVRKHRDIKLVVTKSNRNYFEPEPSYHTANFFLETYYLKK